MTSQTLDQWNAHGSLAQRAADIFTDTQNPQLQTRADRMRSCLRSLKVYTDGHFWPAYACADPICPCCQGRRARVTGKYLNGLRNLLAANDGQQLVSACFTVRNIPPQYLRAEVIDITTAFNSGFLRSLKYRLAASPSYVRKLELTRAADGTAHPHIHALFALPEGTTDNLSLSQMWQDAGKLGYTPDVYWHVIPESAPIAEVTRELRYVLKQPLQITHAMLNDPAFLLAAASSLSGIRTTSAGGAFRQFAEQRRSEPFADSAISGVRLEWTGNEYWPFRGGRFQLRQARVLNYSEVLLETMLRSQPWNKKCPSFNRGHSRGISGWADSS